MIENEHVELWNRCLHVIRDNVPETTFDTWFKPIVPLKYEDKALTIGIPSPFFYESSRDCCALPSTRKLEKVHN